MTKIQKGGDHFPWLKKLMGGDVWPWSIKRLPKDIPLSARELLGRTILVIRPGDPEPQNIEPGLVLIILDDEDHIVDIVFITKTDPKNTIF